MPQGANHDPGAQTARPDHPSEGAPDGIEHDIRSCINGQTLVMGIVTSMLLLVMLLIVFRVFVLLGHSGDLMTVDSSIHALDRRLARIESLLQTRLTPSGPIPATAALPLFLPPMPHGVPRGPQKPPAARHLCAFCRGSLGCQSLRDGIQARRAVSPMPGMHDEVHRIH